MRNRPRYGKHNAVLRNVLPAQFRNLAVAQTTPRRKQHQGAKLRCAFFGAQLVSYAVDLNRACWLGTFLGFGLVAPTIWHGLRSSKPSRTAVLQMTETTPYACPLRVRFSLPKPANHARTAVGARSRTRACPISVRCVAAIGARIRCGCVRLVVVGRLRSCRIRRTAALRLSSSLAVFWGFPLIAVDFAAVFVFALASQPSFGVHPACEHRVVPSQIGSNESWPDSSAVWWVAS